MLCADLRAACSVLFLVHVTGTERPSATSLPHGLLAPSLLCAVLFAVIGAQSATPSN